jgi:Interferon-induced 6-16 family
MLTHEVPGLVSRLGKHIKDNPITFGLQALGGTAVVASLVAVPVLGFVGFSAAGPVAGSAAAAWQASVGLVEAGSLFAWCQSAAMGGAAFNGILALGATGAGVVGVSSLGGSTKEVREKFKKAFEKFKTEEE